MHAATPWSRIAPALAGLGLLYLATQFTRNVLGVINHHIEEALSLKATETALLAAAMFLSYGLAQVPAAALLTRLGPRRVLPPAAALLAASLWGFAEARSFEGLLAARLLMGIAAAPMLAGSFAVYTGFGEARFTTLTGLQTAFGRLGVIVATTPLALLVAAVGWRPALAWAAFATAMAGLAACAALFSLPRPQASTSATGAGSPLRDLLGSKVFRRAALLQGMATAVGSTLLGLWGGPWLDDVHGLDLRQQGVMLLGLAVAAFLSAPAWGLIARRGPPRRLMLGAVALAALLLALPAAVHLPLQLILPWFVLLGFATGFYPALLGELRSSLPPGTIVYLSTLLTAVTMLTVFLVQFASGLIADQFTGRPGWHSEMAYAAINLFMAGLLAVAGLAYRALPAPSAGPPDVSQARPAIPD